MDQTNDAWNKVTEVRAQLDALTLKAGRNRMGRFIVAAMSSIPWVGSLMEAGVTWHSEKEQEQINVLQRLWIEEHQLKIEALYDALYNITELLGKEGAEVHQRIESTQYLQLVKKGFREWNNAETDEKKQYIQHLLINAGRLTLSTDDLIRLFIDWIRVYHETHFLIIKEIYKNERATRKEIWASISEDRPEESSIEADLYKLLIRDLSTGGIIRQERAQDGDGNMVKKKRKSTGLTSAFDDLQYYELTELGFRFVQYAMEEERE